MPRTGKTGWPTTALAGLAVLCVACAPARHGGREGGSGGAGFSRAAPTSTLKGFTPSGSRRQRRLEKRFEAALKQAGPPGRGPQGSGPDAASWLEDQLREAGWETQQWEFQARVRARTWVRLTLRQPGMDPEERTAPVFAFSPPADVDSDLVYAHAGSLEDYAALEEMGTSIAGRVVLITSPSSTPFGQARLAAAHGAVAVLLAPGTAGEDPPPGILSPHGMGPPSGPASPPEPPSSGRWSPLPAAPIPALWLESVLARRLLAALEGSVAPGPWQAEGAGTQHVGPGPARVELRVSHTTESHPAANVLARVIGSDWPEQRVIVGAGLDDGLSDSPHSGDGMAALEAIGRGVGDLLRSGWRPRRTLLLVGWGASRFGHTGATVWADAAGEGLRSGTVGYLHLDTADPEPAPRFRATGELRAFIAMTAAERLDDPLGMPPPVARPAGAGEAGVLISRGVPTATLHLGRARKDGPLLWGLAFLRLAESLWPPYDYAVTAARRLDDLGGLMEAAGAAFEKNPPPPHQARRALIDLRNAAEDWNQASQARLDQFFPAPQKTAPFQQWLARVGRAVLAIDAPWVHREAGAVADGCDSLFLCVDPAGEAVRPFPRARASVEAGDRSALTIEMLRLAVTARDTAHRLRSATDLLENAPGPQGQPGHAP
ncbi:MAG: hypothetical protein ACE5HD_11090 [Acidobacteriota bacterium]